MREDIDEQRDYKGVVTVVTDKKSQSEPTFCIDV